MFLDRLATIGWQYADVLLASTLEVNIAGRRSEDREVSSQACVRAGNEARSSLPHDDRTCIHPLAAETLDAQPLARAVVNVLR